MLRERSTCEARLSYCCGPPAVPPLEYILLDRNSAFQNCLHGNVRWFILIFTCLNSFLCFCGQAWPLVLCHLKAYSTMGLPLHENVAYPPWDSNLSPSYLCGYHDGLDWWCLPLPWTTTEGSEQHSSLNASIVLLNLVTCDIHHATPSMLY